MAKRGRPVDPNAKRDGINLRLSSEENSMLLELSKRSGKTRTSVMVDCLKNQYERTVGNRGGDK